MDLNNDGLVTADEYLRFARQRNIDIKVEAFNESGGTDRPTGGWGLGGTPIDKSSASPGGEKGRGPWGGGERGKGTGGSDNKGGEKTERKKNPWGKGKN
jgi:hypothetical protein